MEQINSFIEVSKEKNINDLLISLGIIILFLVVSSLFSKFVMKVFKIKNSEKTRFSKNDVYIGLKRIFSIIGFYIAMMILNLPDTWIFVCTKIIKILLIIESARVVTGILAPNSRFMRKIEKNERLGENKAATTVIAKGIKIIVYIIAGFMIIIELGYDLSGLITGLGLSSVVIALAAQELVSNMISGFAIISDKPFEIGDYITVGNYSGTVIDINFRSTKIKTVENTVVTIQNSKIVSESVVNVSKIDKRRVENTLRLSLDTKSKQISQLIDSLKMVIYSNQEVVTDSLQINVSEIEKDAITIFIYFYINIVEYNEFLKFKTKNNLSIIKLLEDKNIKLAYPGYRIISDKDAEI